ncbi:MAG: helix-turn-helix domain-containing protein [Saprospiraceae bacterium]|nr:helix-turn-helix domain-containing protein [Saprospiraceae bacterium]
MYDISSKDKIWTGRFDEYLYDISASYTNLITQVVDAIRDNYGHFDFESLFLKNKTASEDAYDYYLKGKFFRNRWTKEDYEKAITYFEKAVQIDPHFAEAYYELQHCYGFLWTKGWISRSKAFERIKVVTVKGLTLGPKLPEAYLSAAQIDLWSKWDFKPAIDKLLDGVRQFPAFIELQNTLVAAYKIVGQYDKAENHSDICIALDPNNHFHYYNRGRISFLKRDYAKAVENIERSISMQPNFKMGMFDLFEIYLVTGDREAFDSFTEQYASFEHVPMMKYIFSLKNSSETNFEDDSEAGASGVDGERLLLSTYKVLFQGNHSLAINLIEQGIRAHLSQFIFIKDNPILDSLKEYDAFNDMMSSVFEIEVNEQKKSRSQEPSPKVKQVLSEEQVDYYTKKLEQVYDEGECYLNPSLSLKDVSLEMVIHPNKLSWLINEKFKMNFNEFTNHYRLNAFKANAFEPSNQHLTILAIAYESGFSSKTSFNSFFKKIEECSPRDWIKNKK